MDSRAAARTPGFVASFGLARLVTDRTQQTMTELAGRSASRMRPDDSDRQTGLTGNTTSR